MSWIIWIISIYALSLWGAVKFCKEGKDEVKRDDLPIILIPGFNTFVVVVLTFVAIKENKTIGNAVKCMGDFVAKVLNKL